MQLFLLHKGSIGAYQGFSRHVASESRCGVRARMRWFYFQVRELPRAGVVRGAV